MNKRDRNQFSMLDSKHTAADRIRIIDKTHSFDSVVRELDLFFDDSAVPQIPTTGTGTRDVTNEEMIPILLDLYRIKLEIEMNPNFIYSDNNYVIKQGLTNYKKNLEKRKVADTAATDYRKNLVNEMIHTRYMGNNAVAVSNANAAAAKDEADFQKRIKIEQEDLNLTAEADPGRDPNKMVGFNYGGRKRRSSRKRRGSRRKRRGSRRNRRSSRRRRR